MAPPPPPLPGWGEGQAPPPGPRQALALEAELGRRVHWEMPREGWGWGGQGLTPLALRNLCLFFLPGWGLPGDGPAPVQELDSWGSGKLPTSLKGPCLGGPTAPAPPLGSHNATADRSVFHHVLSPPSPSAGVHHLGAGGSGLSGGGRDTMAMGLLLPAPLRLQTLGRGRPGASDLQG